MSVSFPEDDWYPEDEYLFEDMSDDEAEFVKSALMDLASVILPEDEMDALVAEFGDFLNATPDGVDPHEEG